MKRKGNFICFIGIDGAGKTTHAKALAKIMEKNGVKCKYMWCRFEPFLIAPFITLAPLTPLTIGNIQFPNSYIKPDFSI